ncbi:MAG: dihydrofolate reductase [Bacteroidaceae bacterium]|nr:dihydrofolate reductase [Bacteroidaceae bacterium]
MISIISAVAENNAIGFENKLIYWLPNDLKRFKSLTTGNTIIMGRRTFESLPKGALPNRRNIVLSRTGKAGDFPGCDLFASLEEALKNCRAEEEVFIIGGHSVYRDALPLADRLCLTLVHDTPTHADTFFPDFAEGWKEVWREDHDTDEKHSQKYSFVDFERI